MWLKIVGLLIFLLLTSLSGIGKFYQPFTQYYFQNPMNIPILLAGGFGEVRPNHFHTGIDIKTEGRENLPVFASADGYISRISISYSGYGNCVYVTHPNGFTTVYGHLNNLVDFLQQWLEGEQYKRQSWEGDFYPYPGLFRVKQGQQIAWSGATGGVAGPHLHFEIRNTYTDEVYNELLFDLPVKDNLPPTPESLAIYEGSKSVYQQTPKGFPLKRISPNTFGISEDVVMVKDSLISMGVSAKDFMNGSQNWMGIFRFKVFMDDQLQMVSEFKKLRFAYSRYANAFMDYKTQKEKGITYQLLWKLPNNLLNVYSYLNPNNGKLNVGDGQVHQIKIELYDAFENLSEIKYKVQYVPYKASGRPSGQAEIGKAGLSHSYEDASFKIKMDDKALYDDVDFEYQVNPKSTGLSDEVQILSPIIPMQSFSDVYLKLKQPIPTRLQDKLAIIHQVRAAALPGNHPQTGMAGNYKDGWAHFSVRTFGSYLVVYDTIPPRIQLIRPIAKNIKKGEIIQFTATDAISTVKECKVFVNGHWLRFLRRGNSYVYRVDSHFPDGKSELIITAMDENGNINEQRYTIFKG